MQNLGYFEIIIRNKFKSKSKESALHFALCIFNFALSASFLSVDDDGSGDKIVQGATFGVNDGDQKT